jgi:hypothetical protein
MAADLHFRCFFAGNYREANQRNWYFEWSRTLFPYIVIPLLIGCIPFLPFAGWRDTYTLGGVGSVATGCALLCAIVRRQSFPWHERSRPQLFSLTLTAAVISPILVKLALDRLLPGATVSHILVPILLALACLAGMAITSVEGFFDYTAAGSFGLTIGGLYGIVAHTLIPGESFIGEFRWQ